MSVLAALALRLKMNAEETSVIWLDRYAEQEALEGRSARARGVAVCFSTEMRAVLAHTKVPMRSTRSYSGQYLVQSVAHRGLLLRVERAHGAHQMCVLKTLSVLIGGGNHLTSSHNDRAAMLCP